MREFWVHEEFKDVMCEMYILWGNETEVRVELVWWNKSQTGKPFPLGHSEVKVLSKADIRDKWKRVEYDVD